MAKNTIRELYIKDIEGEYARMFSGSKKCFEEGASFFPNRASHTARLFHPFPPYIQSALGSGVRTVDGIELIDFWQGHFTNLLGHNHPALVRSLHSALEHNRALQLGLMTPLENDLALLLQQTTGFDSSIFTTSGTLATLYAIMLGLAATKRSMVLKLEGGWHGAHPWSLVGVKYPEGPDITSLESSGLQSDLLQQVRTVPINDLLALQNFFKQYGNKLGVFVLELVLGNSGMVVATKEFIQEARRLTEQYGVVLVLDEMVTGFRLRAGGMYELYDIKPDVVTFGKVMSGGMPFACIVGKREILAEASVIKKPRVWADGGTFSCHPASLNAAISMIQYLVGHEQEIYPPLINKMNVLRNQCRTLWQNQRVDIDITGESQGGGIPNFPIGTIRFIRDRKVYDPTRAIHHWNQAALDIEKRDRLTRIALMLKGIYSWQGLGVITHSHSEADITAFVTAYKDVAAGLAEI